MGVGLAPGVGERLGEVEFLVGEGLAAGDDADAAVGEGERADLEQVKVGSRIQFFMVQGDEGAYHIDTIQLME